MDDHELAAMQAAFDKASRSAGFASAFFAEAWREARKYKPPVLCGAMRDDQPMRICTRTDCKDGDHRQTVSRRLLHWLAAPVSTDDARNDLCTCEHIRAAHDPSCLCRCEGFVKKSADYPKAAPSLADRLSFLLEYKPQSAIEDVSADLWGDILAALRAVEAVRAYRPDLDDSDASYVEGFRHGVEAVQALLEGEL